MSDRTVPLEIDGDVTDEARHVTLSLNGAVVVRPRRRRARPDAAGSADDVVATARIVEPPPPLPPVPAEGSLRGLVEHLHQAIATELGRRQDAAGLEAADSLPVPVHRLSSITGDLPRVARAMPHLLSEAARSVSPGTLRRAGRATLDFVHEHRRLAGRAAAGEDYLDDFGFDRAWTETMLPAFRWIFDNYFRVKVEGLENVPSEGRALLVSNHAGVLPYDGAMIRVAVFDAHPAHRHARALILNAFFGVPVASWFLRRTGNTLAHPHDAERLLRSEELVLVFPEGAKGTGKNYGDRYRLRRFGRGGFVSIAVRTGAPIIPVSVVGSEEVHPMIANVTPVANALGMPYFPLTPTFPLLGPLGLLPVPSSWIIRFHPPIDTAAHGADRADDAALVMRLSDQVRDTIQAGLYAGLEERGSVFA